MSIVRWLLEVIDEKCDYVNEENSTKSVVKAFSSGLMEGVIDGLFITGVIVAVAKVYVSIKNTFKK